MTDILVFYNDLLNLVSLTNGINHFKTVNYFSKAGVHAVQVGCIVA